MSHEAAAAAVSRGDEARDRLVLLHEALARRVVRRYRRHGLERDDLLQQARLGLLKASTRFDTARGVRFGTYAAWWVRQAAQEAVRQQRQNARSTRAYAARLRARLVDAAAASRPLSDDAECVRACLRRLPPAEAAVLRLRYGLDGCSPRTCRAVARLFALKPDVVARLERRGRARLKVLIEVQRRRDVE